MSEPRSGAYRALVSQLVDQVAEYGFPIGVDPQYAKAIDSWCAKFAQAATPDPLDAAVIAAAEAWAAHPGIRHGTAPFEVETALIRAIDARREVQRAGS